MLIKGKKEVHPLRRGRITLGEQTVYDRMTPRRSTWFILDLALPGKGFIPVGSTGMRTADGMMMSDRCRRGHKKG